MSKHRREPVGSEITATRSSPRRTTSRRPNHLNCIFCDWIEDQRLAEKERYRLIYQTDDYILILDRNPRVVGHTLLISTKQLDDITELVSDPQHAAKLIRGLAEACALLKEKLTGPRGKIYVMTMCDHWELDEIDDATKTTTEHLHFHLLPRYPDMRTTELAGENMFTRPRAPGTSREMLAAVKKKLIEPKRLGQKQRISDC